MPNDLREDLQHGAASGADFTSGLEQYLHGHGRSLSDYERRRNSELGSQVGAGLTGLEYLTGSKKPEVETFYDKHPAQAVTRDAADKAPMIGAGVAAAGAGHNLYRDFRNSRQFDKIEDTFLHGKEDKDGKSKPGAGKGFDEHDPYSKFRDITRKMPMRGGDEEYARFVEGNLPKLRGGAKMDSNVAPHLGETIKEHLGGNEGRARNITSIIEGRANSNIPSSLLRGLSRVKGPAMLGGGIALGGMGLSAILKAVHKHTYGDDKIKDWTNNMRMVKGKFDELER